MKKLLGIMVLSLMLSGNAYADEPRVWFKNENTIHIAHKTHMSGWFEDVRRVAIEHCNSHDKYMFWVQTTRGGAPINKHYKSKIKNTYKGSWVTEIFCSKEKLAYAPKDSFVPGNKIYATNYIETEQSNVVAIDRSRLLSSLLLISFALSYFLSLIINERKTFNN